MNRQDWHEYYVKNKHRFTSSLLEAKNDKNKIYFENAESPVESSNLKNISLSQEEGDNLEYHYGRSYGEDD